MDREIAVAVPDISVADRYSADAACGLFLAGQENYYPVIVEA
jgi:hypothetical protein